MDCVTYYGCPVSHFVLIAVFALGIVFPLVCVAAIYFLVFWCGIPTNIFLLSCVLCVCCAASKRHAFRSFLNGFRELLLLLLLLWGILQDLSLLHGSEMRVAMFYKYSDSCDTDSVWELILFYVLVGPSVVRGRKRKEYQSTEQCEKGREEPNKIGNDEFHFRNSCRSSQERTACHKYELRIDVRKSIQTPAVYNSWCSGPSTCSSHVRLENVKDFDHSKLLILHSTYR